MNTDIAAELKKTRTYLKRFTAIEKRRKLTPTESALKSQLENVIALGQFLSQCRNDAFRLAK